MTYRELYENATKKLVSSEITLGEYQEMTKPLEEEVRGTGHWVMPVRDDGTSDPICYQVRCSKCGFDLDPQTWHTELHQYGADKYCPNCGAKMEVEK